MIKFTTMIKNGQLTGFDCSQSNLDPRGGDMFDQFWHWIYIMSVIWPSWGMQALHVAAWMQSIFDTL